MFQQPYDGKRYLSHEREGFVKAPASPSAFKPLNQSVFNALAPVQKSGRQAGERKDSHFLRALCVSRILHGRSSGERTVEVGAGKTVEVEEGETWCSATSITEDISAATGRVWERHKVKYALSRIDGLTSRMARGGASRGYYGKCFRLASGYEPDPNSPLVMPEYEYRLSRYGEAMDYRRSRVLVGSYAAGERYTTDAKDFRAGVHSGRICGEAYMNPGRWRTNAEASDPNAPVYLPYWTVDIDGLNPVDSWEAARVLMERLMDEGIDPAVCVVSYTGGRGFHIEIPSIVAGPRIYESSEAAHRAMTTFFTSLLGKGNFDPATLSPRTMVRLYGSDHADGGSKRGTDGRSFLSWGMPRFFETARSGGDLTALAEPAPKASLEAKVDDAEAEAARRLREQRSQSRKDGNIGTDIDRILSGIAEGEHWSDRWAGRHLALYVLACFCYESASQADKVRRELGVGQSQDPVEVWNDRLCHPSLPANRVRSITRNAQKTVQ